MYWIVLYDQRLFKTRGVLPYMGHIGMCRCEGFSNFMASLWLLGLFQPRSQGSLLPALQSERESRVGENPGKEVGPVSNVVLLPC